MDELRSFLMQNAEGELLAWHHQQAVARRFDLSLAEVESAALEAGLLPARYQRNRQMLTIRQQLELFRGKVAVVGCGGLGGYILEELGRLGVGHIVAIDPDIFEENNLNRQLLSSPARLGQAKAEAAAERIAEINPAVTLRPVQEHFTRDNAAEMFAGADCVVDAVDNVPARLELEAACEQMNLPLVHAAIAGWYGHVATICPGEGSVQKI